MTWRCAKCKREFPAGSTDPRFRATTRAGKSFCQRTNCQRAAEKRYRKETQ